VRLRRQSDEELAAARVRPRQRHAGHAAGVAQPADLVADGVARPAETVAARIAGLDHEIGHDAVEEQPVVEVLGGELQEVEAGARRPRAIEAQAEAAAAGADLDGARPPRAVDDLAVGVEVVGEGAGLAAAGGAERRRRPAEPRQGRGGLPPQRVARLAAETLEQLDDGATLARLRLGAGGERLDGAERRFDRLVAERGDQGAGQLCGRHHRMIREPIAGRRPHSFVRVAERGRRDRAAGPLRGLREPGRAARGARPAGSAAALGTASPGTAAPCTAASTASPGTAAPGTAASTAAAGTAAPYPRYSGGGRPRRGGQPRGERRLAHQRSGIGSQAGEQGGVAQQPRRLGGASPQLDLRGAGRGSRQRRRSRIPAARQGHQRQPPLHRARGRGAGRASRSCAAGCGG